MWGAGSFPEPLPQRSGMEFSSGYSNGYPVAEVEGKQTNASEHFSAQSADELGSLGRNANAFGGPAR